MNLFLSLSAFVSSPRIFFFLPLSPSSLSQIWERRRVVGCGSLEEKRGKDGKAKLPFSRHRDKMCVKWKYGGGRGKRGGMWRYREKVAVGWKWGPRRGGTKGGTKIERRLNSQIPKPEKQGGEGKTIQQSKGREWGGNGGIVFLLEVLRQKDARDKK